MKLKIKPLLMLASASFALLFVTNATSKPAQWSRFIKTKSQDNVVISFRQKRKNQGWLIEWHVKNGGEDKVEPILISRHYTCNNGEHVELFQQSLGVYLPGDSRRGGIADKGICPNSKIKYVEIESEILTLLAGEQTAVSQP
jgi:hypothetical protein